MDSSGYPRLLAVKKGTLGSAQDMEFYCSGGGGTLQFAIDQGVDLGYDNYNQGNCLVKAIYIKIVGKFMLLAL